MKIVPLFALTVLFVIGASGCSHPTFNLSPNPSSPQNLFQNGSNIPGMHVIKTTPIFQAVLDDNVTQIRSLYN
jgi:hypothetical protein